MKGKKSGQDIFWCFFNIGINIVRTSKCTMHRESFLFKKKKNIHVQFKVTVLDSADQDFRQRPLQESFGIPELF